ncbi:alanine racemase [Breoghania corrubedonensis]|uniref:Alanine racemase n=1 Tax=Breoghania corrubedonensis TaxID=665038 RepID=A0A2T5V9M6_9HYPH|nr:alanine racemase [Breoghania corrubedonensis]PTW60452.1 alanine racemase [Breoghania corrubedonensis]
MADTRKDSLACGRLTIDLAALADNWRSLAQRTGKTECGAAIKGDGYGTGLEKAAVALSQAGCRTFFTAVPQEGLRARAAAPDARVFVLAGLLPGAAESYRDGGLIPVLNCPAEVLEWSEFCASTGQKLPAALHLDTGMNRMGLDIDEARTIAQAPDVLTRFDLALVMSHLVCGGDPENPLNALQLERFHEMTALFPCVPRSLANSPGIFLGPDFHFDVARPGISLYGGRAMDEGENPMRPVVTAEARVLITHSARNGETVGYGAVETLRRNSRIAIVGIGYADGYHRLAGAGGGSDTAKVWINGHKVPLVGRVSMDLIAVDVTDVPERECLRGDWVEMFGPHIPVDEAAAAADTIGYEFLTGLGSRYARTYIGASDDRA